MGGRTLTNASGWQFSREETLGNLPVSPVWKILEPNDISSFGASITKVARSPISKNRQEEKGTVTDLDSAAEFAVDTTMDLIEDVAEPFVFANFIGQEKMKPTAATVSAYTIPAGTAHPENTLVVGFGFFNSENNGLKLVDAGSTATSVLVVETLVAETPAVTKNVSLEVAGFRFPVGDLEVDANGDLISTLTDLTSLGLIPGQSIWVGGDETVNSFALANNRGYARVVSVVTNKIVLENRQQDYTIDVGDAKLIDLYFGRFLKNVPVDDANYLEQSLQFEATYTDIEDPGDAYEYSEGGYSNVWALDLPLTDKSASTIGFVGTDTPVPTTVRRTNADSPLIPVKTTALNTSQDIARLRIQDVDENGLTTDFKSASITLDNGVSGEKVLGNLGPKYMNVSNFKVGLDSELLFSNIAVPAAIRNNETLGLDFALRNEDGAVMFDIPSMTLEGGDKSFPVNESINISVTANAFRDETYDASIMISLFPYVPAS